MDPMNHPRRRSILPRLPLAALLLGCLALASLPSASVAQDGGAKKKVAAQKDEPEAVEIARKMQDFYTKTKDYQATFRQTYTDLAAGETKRSYGRVYFKKPGKMRWDYYQKAKKDKKSEREKVLVSDGNVFWIYEYDFQQVFKRCLADSQLPTSLKFLLGQGDLVKDFYLSQAPGSSEERPVLKLVPRKDQEKSKYKELRFEVDPKTFQVVKTTIYDPYGNTNQIVFSKVLVNKNLPDKGFSFTPPKSARVLNPQKKCAQTADK